MGERVVTLVLPRERDFHPVAQLVLAGLAARLELTYEGLDDLQLALAGLLEREEADDDVVVRLAVDEGSLALEIGPFEPDGLRLELERDELGVVGLRRLLETVADSVALSEDESGIVVRLVKHRGLTPTQS